jgi:nicotinic acid phosphoribosyltransferase
MKFIPRNRQSRESSNNDSDVGVVEFGEIAINVKGPWRECILYEVPLMFILCEGYFKIDDKDWIEDHDIIRGTSHFPFLSLSLCFPLH